MYEVAVLVSIDVEGKHTSDKAINTITISEMVPEMKPTKSNIRVDPQSVARATRLVWLRIEKIPLSPHIAMKAMKKPIVHNVINTNQAMMTGLYLKIRKTCR